MLGLVELTRERPAEPVVSELKLGSGFHGFFIPRLAFHI